MICQSGFRQRLGVNNAIDTYGKQGQSINSISCHQQATLSVFCSFEYVSITKRLVGRIRYNNTVLCHVSIEP